MNSLLIDQVYLEENHKEIDTFLGNLKDIGVVNLTIASPLLFYYIKQSFPDFKLQISTVTNVLSIQQARYWNAIGASRIILSEWITRKFKLLKNIRLAVDCELELLANEYCVSFCSDRSCHYIIQSMTNRENKAIEYKHLDKFRYVTKYPYSICFPYMCRDGIHNLNSNWIRPEDLKYYSSIGYDIFKIVGRTYPKQTVKLIVEAYMKQRYDGNFYDLGPFYSSKENKEKNKSIFSGLYIDNRNLDGFIKYIIDKDIHCDEQCGIDCFYCKEFFEQIMEKQLLSEKSNIE
jgi:collagenase-like PrtC family protease